MAEFKKFNPQDYRNCLIVTDEYIGGLYGIKGDNVYYAPRGERAKTFAEAEKLCKWLLDAGLERNGVLVAVGGGSIGDAVGFVASIFKRGIKLVHVPTTLIAQIDSSIGGKTALDIGAVKNAVGTFYVAETRIDTDFLETLDDEQLLSGKGELMKYRMLNRKIDETACRGDLAETIGACVKYKEITCEIDPFDTGIRQTLNFGHTIGHAMELSANITHGEAVVNGLYYETELAFKLGLCARDYRDKWQEEITRIFNIRPLTETILNISANDKKNADGKIGFVLPCKFEKYYASLDELKRLLLYA